MATDQPIPSAVLDRLECIDADLAPGLSKHDRVSMLIAVCIVEGVTEGKLICLALKLLGYNPRHVGLTLGRGGAHMPPEHRWYKDSGGHYRLP